MKKLACAVLFVAFGVLLYSSNATSQPKIADFHMNVFLTETGITIECSKGCAFTELSVGCEGECEFGLDAQGMTDLAVEH